MCLQYTEYLETIDFTEVKFFMLKPVIHIFPTTQTADTIDFSGASEIIHNK